MRLGPLALLLLAGCASAPLPVPQVREAMLSHPDGRATAVRILHPRCAAGEEVRLVLFSHGANSSPEKYDALTRRWAADYVVAAPLHADPPGGSPQRSWALRMADMALLLGSVGRLEAATGCDIRDEPVGAAGHSYGALVAQALGGARLAFERTPQRDPRVAAVVALSPPGPIRGYIEPAGWSGVAVPMYVQTGTADVLPMIAPAWEAHLASWDAASTPGVLFVGEGVDHYFGNLIGRPERPPPAPTARDAFELVTETSHAFLDHHLGGDRESYEALAPAAVRLRFPEAVARYELR